MTREKSLTQILFEWKRDSKRYCNTLPEPIAQEGLNADRALFLFYHLHIYYYWYLLMCKLHGNQLQFVTETRMSLFLFD